jgi:hypothetical protein
LIDLHQLSSNEICHLIFKLSMQNPMDNLPADINAKAGTAGGTLLILFIQIGTGEVVKTILLAGLGAMVSYTVSMGMKWLCYKFRKK